MRPFVELATDREPSLSAVLYRSANVPELTRSLIRSCILTKEAIACDLSVAPIAKWFLLESVNVTSDVLKALELSAALKMLEVDQLLVLAAVMA